MTVADNPKVLWKSGAYRIVVSDETWWTGARKVNKLRLEKSQRSKPEIYVPVKNADYLSFPRGRFFSRGEAIAFLQGYAERDSSKWFRTHPFIA